MKIIKTANYKEAQEHLNYPPSYNEEYWRSKAEMNLSYPFSTLEQRRKVLLDKFVEHAVTEGKTEADEKDVQFANTFLIRELPNDSYGRPQSRDKVLQEAKDKYGIEVIPVTKEELNQMLINNKQGNKNGNV